MKITTKTGDRGETGLFGGKRVSKASPFIEMVGELDELQSFVGWARCGYGGVGDGEASAGADPAISVLNRVQDDIYRMMSVVGFEMKCPEGMKAISDDDSDFLERRILEGQQGVKDLNKFIRPGTCEIAARLQVTRAVCRRVERRMVGNESVAACGGGLYSPMVKYLNRLSDLLFIMAYKFEE
ncbi:MAG: cob(I)yrinic acid a,c-diamide adenosyltransferase [bacterium]|nr:cob(I)yrinic acid a,c-diamide adenosyltransferase [bacterium]